MDRIIRQITEHFVANLPEGADYYRVDELEQSGFPPFLVRRIHIELQWNLDESMILPKTDWANTDSEAVQQAWHHFLNAIHAEVRLPASYAKAVVETAVADIMEMLVQPRRNIPDILFGGEDMLSADDLAERTELLVVYPHFARVLTSYMKRKNRDSLQRERCKKIVREVDERVTARYTPLQWAQMLDPLFTLAGPKVDTDLMRLFFDDRNMQRTAGAFDGRGDPISRAEFIEVLSSPELLEHDRPEGQPADEPGREYGLDMSDRPEDAAEQEETKTASETGASVADQRTTRRTDEESRPDEEEMREEGSAEPKPDFEVRATATADDEQEDADEPGSEPLQWRQEEAYGYEPGDEETGDEEEHRSLNDLFTDEPADREAERPSGGDEKGEEAQTDREQQVELMQAGEPAEERPDEEEDEAPIWQRFVDSDEDEEARDRVGEQYRANDEISDENDEVTGEVDEEEEEGSSVDYIDEPVIDLREGGDAGQEKRALEKALRDQRDYFVKELFNGSERAYDQSIGDIARNDTWKEASKTIEQNIFKRNMIDIYSNAAIDFTDRLQDYFMNKKNRN